MGRLGMATCTRRPLMGGLLPDDRAGLLVQGVHHPSLLGVVARRVPGTVETDLEGRLAVGADRGRDKHPVAPDDRAGVAQSGDRRLPTEVPVRTDLGVRVPRGRRRGGRDPARAGAAERGPIHGVVEQRGQDDDHQGGHGPPV